MKYIFKQTLKFSILLLTLSILAISCQKDDDIKDIENELPKTSSEYSTKIIDKAKIIENKNLSRKLKKLEKNLSKIKTSQSDKIVYSSIYDFYINTNFATYIENSDGSYHSYTFPIYRTIETDSLENLLVSLQTDGSYKVMKITYNTTAQEKENINNGISVDLAHKVNAFVINDSEINDGLFNKEVACPRVILSCCSFGNPNHPFGFIVQGPGVVGDFCPGHDTCYYDGQCETNDTGASDGADGADNSNPNNDNGQNNNTNNDQTNNGGSSNTDTTTPTGTSCDTCPEIDEECLMSDEDLNAQYSLNSPFNVDLSLVRKSCDTITTPENDKFMCIYKKLAASSKFKDLFIDTFGENENLNVRFELDDTLPNSTGGVTGADPSDPSTMVDGVVFLNLVIRMNKNHMTNNNANVKPTIEIAKNILHECLHAYLYVKKYNCNDGTTFDILNNQLFGDLINEYYDGSCSQFQEQHEFMIDYMLPTMIDILNDIKDDLIPESNQNYVSDLDYNNPDYPNNPFTESHLFNWNEFYKNLSMSGLHNTTQFQQEIANDSIKNYLFYRYVGPTNGTLKQFSKKYCNE